MNDPIKPLLAAKTAAPLLTIIWLFPSDEPTSRSSALVHTDPAPVTNARLLLAIGLTARFRPLRVEPPQSAAISAPRSISAPATTDVPTSTPAATSPPSPAAPTSEGLLARRSGQRIVGGKTFHLVAGEWIDSGYDRLADLPVVQVATPAERAALLARLPALKPYAALGNRVVVVVDAVVYRFDVPLPDSRQ